MRKASILALLLGLILALPTSGSIGRTFTFLGTAVNVSAGGNWTNGGGGVSSTEPDLTYEVNEGSIMVTFTRSAGTTDTVDFWFQVHNGIAWSTTAFLKVQIATNSPADTNVVRDCGTIIQLQGIKKIRLYKIENTDSSNNVTDCNAYLVLKNR